MNDATSGYELLLRPPRTPARDHPPPQARLGRPPDRRLAAQRDVAGRPQRPRRAPDRGRDRPRPGAGPSTTEKRLRAADCEWLRHITEVQAVRRTWWRTRWQSWPPRAGQTREPREVRIALDCDPGSPVQMFQLYVALADDQMPLGAPELRTFHPDADTEMPTEAAVVIETNPAAADLLEWIAWLLFDGRRSAAR